MGSYENQVVLLRAPQTGIEPAEARVEGTCAHVPPTALFGGLGLLIEGALEGAVQTLFIKNWKESTMVRLCGLNP